ncbi:MULTISPECIES: DUF4232 domain-containing protein [unclassified Streptomyces]|uniref:DUF4232 domain-containing protein n=1 Tax=unclassified Streptomyces TaxID=2593676 RepID=UPI003828C3F6
MTASRSRRRSAAYAALALGLCGTLALTGCNSHSKKSKKHSSSSSSKSKKRRLAGGAAAAGAGAGAASHQVPACTPGPYSLRFGQVGNPDGYVTVKFRNTTKRTCRIYNAPRLSFDDKKPLPLLQGEPGMFDSVKNDVPPNGRMYAIIPTATAAAKGSPKTKVSVKFMGTSSSSRGRGPALINFVHRDQTISVGATKVTNWVPSLSGAKVAAQHPAED